MAVRVQAGDFDLAQAMDEVAAGNPRVGGVCAFVGLVRDINEGAAVSTLTLEHYPGMTERQLEKIEAEAHARWPLEKTLIIHRYGRMTPEEKIVLVAAASAHRQAAFEACHYIMDYLKTEAPFWKVEDTGEGERWVEARDSDEAARRKWQG